MRLALVLVLGLATSAFAQNLIPKLSVVSGGGFGCNDANFVAFGTEVYGSTSCSNPAAGNLSCGIDENEEAVDFSYCSGWEGESFYGSYYMTDSLGRNGDGTYFHGVPGETYSGPIYPFSEAGNWFVGGYDMISHNGVLVSYPPEALHSGIGSLPTHGETLSCLVRRMPGRCWQSWWNGWQVSRGSAYLRSDQSVVLRPRQGQESLPVGAE